MDQRAYQVCLTYLQRGPLWLAAIGYLAVCGWALQLAHYPVSVEAPRKAAPYFLPPQPQVRVTDQTRLDQISPDTQSLTWMRMESLPPGEVFSFPNVTYFDLSIGMPKGDEARLLRSMPKLESFSYFGASPEPSLKLVSDVPGIHYLRVMNIEPKTGLKYLRKFSQLEVLDIQEIQDYASLFDEIRRLPRLQTLIIPGQTTSNFKASDWERLRSLSGLKRVYLRGNIDGPDFLRTEVDRVQAILSQAAVRPDKVFEHRSKVWSPIALASAIVWGVLILQLQTQFSHAQSCVMPHYSKYHLWVAAFLFVGTTLFNSWILWSADCSVAGSLAGSLIVPGLFWWLCAAPLHTTGQRQIGLLNPFFVAAMCFQVWVMASACRGVFFAEIDWFLSGRQPGLAWSIVVFSLLGAAFVLLRMPRLHSFYIQSRAGLPPLGFGINSWMSWGKSAAESHEGTWISRFRARRYTQLDTLLTTPGISTSSRLWIAGNETNGWSVCQKMLVFAIYFSGMALILNYFRPPPPPHSMFGSFGLMMCVMIDSMSLGLAAAWRIRRSVLSYELLRPLTRKVFIDRLFLAMARDLLPVLGCHVLSIVILWKIAGPVVVPHLLIPAILCYIVFRALILYVTTVILFTVRPGWVVAVWLPVAWSLLGLSAVYLAVGSMRAENWFPALAISFFFGLSVIALICLKWIRSYWDQIELA